MMKKFFRACIPLSILALTLVSTAGAASLSASLTATYDFTGKVDETTVFEGLTFMGDSLWITSSPFGDMGDNFFDQASNLANADPVTLLQVDLGAESVVNVFDYSINGEATNQVEYMEMFGFKIPIGLSNAFNPVGLASDGEQLFIANNLKVSGGVYTSDGSGDAAYSSMVDSEICQEPEGAAYLDGHVYLSCQDTGNVVKVNNDGSVEEVLQKTGSEFLGLAAIEDSGTLIIGDATEEKLWLYNASTGQEDYIDLTTIFGDSVPDPDGLAYHDGKIYMSYEHDPKIYEISLNAIANPEPGTLLLIGSGIVALAATLRKKRS